MKSRDDLLAFTKSNADKAFSSSGVGDARHLRIAVAQSFDACPGRKHRPHDLQQSFKEPCRQREHRTTRPQTERSPLSRVAMRGEIPAHRWHGYSPRWDHRPGM